LIHCVFSTKERRSAIPENLIPRLFRYLNGIGSNIYAPVIGAGGTDNHVHLLIALPASITLAKAMQTFKDEFLALLKKSGVSYDPKFVFG
jgi:REP element-mobilizing transposase RayT